MIDVSHVVFSTTLIQIRAVCNIRFSLNDYRKDNFTTISIESVKNNDNILHAISHCILCALGHLIIYDKLFQKMLIPTGVVQLDDDGRLIESIIPS